jgi:hypothetical protein
VVGQGYICLVAACCVSHRASVGGGVSVWAVADRSAVSRAGRTWDAAEATTIAMGVFKLVRNADQTLVVTHRDRTGSAAAVRA